MPSERLKLLLCFSLRMTKSGESLKVERVRLYFDSVSQLINGLHRLLTVDKIREKHLRNSFNSTWNKGRCSIIFVHIYLVKWEIRINFGKRRKVTKYLPKRCHQLWKVSNIPRSYEIRRNVLSTLTDERPLEIQCCVDEGEKPKYSICS